MDREASNKILDMVENGQLDALTVIRTCLQYMGEYNVDRMAYESGFLDRDTVEENIEQTVNMDDLFLAMESSTDGIITLNAR